VRRCHSAKLGYEKLNVKRWPRMSRFFADVPRLFSVLFSHSIQFSCFSSLRLSPISPRYLPTLCVSFFIWSTSPWRAFIVSALGFLKVFFTQLCTLLCLFLTRFLSSFSNALFSGAPLVFHCLFYLLCLNLSSYFDLFFSRFMTCLIVA